MNMNTGNRRPYEFTEGMTLARAVKFAEISVFVIPLAFLFAMARRLFSKLSSMGRALLVGPV